MTWWWRSDGVDEYVYVQKKPIPPDKDVEAINFRRLTFLERLDIPDTVTEI
jgi:hypothetical protein